MDAIPIQPDDSPRAAHLIASSPMNQCAPPTSSSKIASAPRERRDEAIRRQTKAIAEGDREAFAALYCVRFDFMYTEARRATGRDEAFCLDVVQDAMLRVIRHLRVPIETEDALMGWLRRVVYSSAIDLLRKEKRANKHECASVSMNRSCKATDESDRLQHRSSGLVLSSRMHKHSSVHVEPMNWLNNEIKQLPDAQSKLIVMRYRFGWTLERIGRAVGLSPGAVDGRIRRIIAALQRSATEDFNE